MKILVTIKRVPDPDTRIRVKPDGSGIVTDGIKHSANPFDAIAVEEALRIRERGVDCEIVVASVGAEDCVEQLRVGLAMGADRGIWIQSDGDLDSLAVAQVLAALCEREKPSLILMGKQAIDDDSNQAGQMLAGLLSLPQATFVSKLELTDANSRARCGRETDSGIETIVVKLPAVITTDLRLNEPRYVSLPGIMKAKKKPVENLKASEVAPLAKSRTHLVSMEAPPKRKAGVRVASVDALIEKLRNEAKIL
ncbi:MAG: electron transfer flavoprotein subunit beta/FixA family protein [Verrucomicrobia bacterium]|nr:electron transfer flavoprotein subunit beta/FixA family protein [Verrucomicrobiota bacterium]MBI3868709.1 electron transfer flavoprotein subunit beta/FixA family protein [Verrucomicrobiota bacterium]